MEELPGCVAFISLQDLKGGLGFGGSFDKLDWVKELEWDLLIIDEAHEGVDTFRTDVAFNNIKRNFTLHLSGTPFKALASGKFTAEQIYNWSYSDEQDAKMAWPDKNEESNPYEGLPRLNLFSYQMSQMITDEVNKGAKIDGEDIDFAFDLNEFFATKDNGKFIHEVEVKKWLDSLTRNEKYPFSTDELRAELKHTLWLLNRVASAKALEKLLKEHSVFKDYKIVLAAGDGRGGEDESVVSQGSFGRVQAAIKEHEKTITLSVGQLTMGVTIPEWTAVMMLSNIKSPSLYMQAAFRAQNPWTYEINGEKQRKQNAYVFDFAPERTLIIYDEFANNLQARTVDGGGANEDRENNIRKLLNFFPVIAEDHDGKMIELDVRQVLTIPKTIKAQEVVKRGFMSNLLFQNISGIFVSAEARKILEKLNPVAPGRVSPNQKPSAIDTKDVKVDGEGNAIIDDIVITTTEARFGNKVYEELNNLTEQAEDQTDSSLTRSIAETFTRGVLETAKEIAKDNLVTGFQAEQIVKENANILAREVEYIEEQTRIKEGEANIEFKKEVAEIKNDEVAVANAKVRYEQKIKEIKESFTQELSTMITEKSKELIQKSTEEILTRAEEKKKTTVEDDIRSRLRGFARTIPSFLMAYGESTTTLANFDENIKDEVFIEVTGINLDQFRDLRDKYKFFDEVVFNESIQEFLRKRAELADYFDDSQDEDIFDYVPPQKTNQIFTPKKVVKMMLDMLEEENPDIFTSKDRTFADLYVKSGLYLTEIVKRLNTGLKKEIPDQDKRLKHILEKQIYGFAPSEIIHMIAKNFIYGNLDQIDSSNLKCSDLTELARSGGDLEMKFDVVVGNPPYQEEAVGGSTSNDPIYNHFYDLAEQVSPKYCLISPARFLSEAGNTPRKWNRKMLNDEHLKIVFYEQKSANIFPNTDIKGGVVVLLRDKEKIFGKIEVFTNFEELNTILAKVSKVNEESIEKLITGRGVYRLTDKALSEYPQIISIQSKGHKNDVGTSSFRILDDLIYFENKPNDGKDYIQILGLLGSNQRVYRWVRKDFINEPFGFEKYKVIIPKANGSGAIGEVLSTPLVGEPLVGFTETFISIGAFDNPTEAQNCLKYVKSKFARTMLGVLKVTQDNTREKWAKVPLQDFSQKSDIDWTQPIPDIDRQLYKKYGLDDNEIAFIEEKVKAMD